MNKIILLLLLLTFGISHSQELNCSVTVNTERLQNANQQVFKTLQTSLTEFVNKTSWTGKNYDQNQKINCSMFITLISQDSDRFVGTIQIQSSRLVYNSSYATPIFNFNDKDFSFNYVEYQQLLFNPNEFDSNLISIIAFYSHLIIGFDADSFEPMGGTTVFESALNIANVAQQSNTKGWNMSDGLTSRYFLIHDLLSNVYKEVREANFLYHSGLDLMTKDLKEAKEKIKSAVLTIGKLNSVKPNAFMTRLFFDAKSDEIVSVFSGGPSITVTDLVSSLNKSSPLNSSKWSEIRF